MTAIGYTRLSQESDTSIERQKRNIRAYADEHDLGLERIYDDGRWSSAFSPEELEEYQKVRSRVFDGDISAVIVNSKRRLARDINEVMRIIPEFRENNIELHTYEDGELDLSNPMRAAIEILQAAAAYEEKLKEIERAIQAVEERLENGYYQGRPPTGLSFDDEGKYLTPDAEEWDAVCRVFELRDREHSYREIADDTGLPKSTIADVLDRGREFYEEYGEVRSRSNRASASSGMHSQQ